MLILLPNLLGPEGLELIPSIVADKVKTLDGLIAESEKAGRSFLHRYKRSAHTVPIALLREDYDFLLEPIEKGETWGMISDAGLPCLADPGSALVRRAREKNIPVEAISGPSSITLALMLSGLVARRFFFQGYLDRDRIPHIRRLEHLSRKERAIQVLIEAPYKNSATFEALVNTLSPRTLLCTACQLTQPDQEVITLSVEEWRGRKPPNIHKKPTIFLYMA